MRWLRCRNDGDTKKPAMQLHCQEGPCKEPEHDAAGVVPQRCSSAQGLCFARACSHLEEEAWVEALDGGLAAMPFAQMHFTIPAAAQKLHQHDVSGVNDFHGAGDPLQTELRVLWLSWC